MLFRAVPVPPGGPPSTDIHLWNATYAIAPSNAFSVKLHHIVLYIVPWAYFQRLQVLAQLASITAVNLRGEGISFPFATGPPR